MCFGAVENESYIEPNTTQTTVYQAVAHGKRNIRKTKKFLQWKKKSLQNSIPDGVIGIFHWLNPSGRTVALVSTQPLTEMSTRDIVWGIMVADA